jgi:hypothetical protein
MIPCHTPARPAGITEQELAGNYQGSGGARVRLGADGTATADILIGDLPGDHISGDGTWVLEPPGQKPWAPDIPFGLTLTFVDGTATSVFRDLQLGGTRESPTLWFYFDDADDCDVSELARAGPVVVGGDGQPSARPK